MTDCDHDFDVNDDWWFVMALSSIPGLLHVTVQVIALVLPFEIILMMMWSKHKLLQDSFLSLCLHCFWKLLSVFRASAWRGGSARPGQASPGSHWIPCPITGRRGLKRGRITLSQQTTGNRKTESAASRRSSQPSTISHGLIGLQLHLLHLNRSFRPGLVCPGFTYRWVYRDIKESKC